MSADPRIKVVFRRVYVRSDADWVGSGEFYFIATVDGHPVGDRSRIFNAREGHWINLQEAQWSAVVNIRRKAEVRVRFQGMDEDVFFDDDLGTVGANLRPPWRQRVFRQAKKHFLLEWEVQLAIEGSFGRHRRDEVFACREHRGSVDCTTVSGSPVVARMECHPVRPVPTVGLPPRRAFPAGTDPPARNTGATAIVAASPINIVPNPAVIPVLTAPGAAAPAGGPPVATATNAARIEFTWYRPRTLAFTDTDSRLVWTARPLAGTGAAAGFVGPARGRRVLVYGTSPGEILLEVRFRGALFATYRALVMAVKRIPCRINILNGPTRRSRPRAKPADCQNHLHIANCYLRQIGLQLTLDANPRRRNGARSTGIPGIFRINVSRGTTRRINSSVTAVRATGLNYRPNVMNFAYIHSERNRRVGGAATDFPASNIAPVAAGGRPTISDSGTPSDSWSSPTGIPPDGAAGRITMSLITAIQRPRHPQLFAMFLCDTIGNPTTAAGQDLYAKSMCHELGHILNLGHRVEGVPGPPQRDMTAADPPATLAAGGIFWDALLYPPQENIMYWAGVNPICQDFDIIQARAVHQSPLVPP
ncbi:MAG: hypothetical protein ACYS0G_16635 [Planctomycetota bacterium]|jgi:hypothetical protein